MKLKHIFLVLAFGPVLTNANAQNANPNPTINSGLGKSHEKKEQWFCLETRVLKYAPNGTRDDSTVYTLWIQSRPATDGDDYTCQRFTIKDGSKETVSIPSLVNFTYHVSSSPGHSSANGKLLGIPQEPFDKLNDSADRRLSIEQNYMVYNSFVDFHSFFVFSEKSDSGRGVQDLHQPGDRIIHSASFSEPHVNLGAQVDDGSYFRNGQIVMEWKGNGPVQGKNCAILDYDSGQSSFFMITKPIPLMKVKTTGSSHYWGDIYKDLEGGWIQKANMHEWVVSETNVPGQSKPLNRVIERSLRLLNLGKNPF